MSDGIAQLQRMLELDDDKESPRASRALAGGDSGETPARRIASLEQDELALEAVLKDAEAELEAIVSPSRDGGAAAAAESRVAGVPSCDVAGTAAGADVAGVPPESVDSDEEVAL